MKEAPNSNKIEKMKEPKYYLFQLDQLNGQEYLKVSENKLKGSSELLTLTPELEEKLMTKILSVKDISDNPEKNRESLYSILSIGTELKTYRNFELSDISDHIDDFQRYEDDLEPLISNKGFELINEDSAEYKRLKEALSSKINMISLINEGELDIDLEEQADLLQRIYQGSFIKILKSLLNNIKVENCTTEDNGYNYIFKYRIKYSDIKVFSDSIVTFDIKNKKIEIVKT